MDPLTFKGHDLQRTWLGQMKERGDLPHALHFTGPEGIGKKLLAKELLMGHLCKEDGLEPCGSCKSCVTFRAGTHPDLIILEKNDKGAIAIGDTESPQAGTARWLISRLNNSPVHGRYAVLIDGMDGATLSAQNALLKLIEEPVDNSLIVMISSRRNNVLPTIRSRAQELSFNPLPVELVYELIKPHVPDAVQRRRAAALSSGSLSQGIMAGNQELLDQVLDICRGIARFEESGLLPEVDTSSLAKEMGSRQFLSLMGEVYRVMFRDLVQGNDRSVLPEEIFINDIDRISAIIKIIQSVKVGLSRNLSVRTMLKGLLYRKEQAFQPGIPYPG